MTKTLADLIVEHGPFIAGEQVLPPLRVPTALDLNELRNELIELRRMRDDHASG
jgi:hypothetical protein